MVFYFIFTFERLFLIMKAGTLTELLKYQKEKQLFPKENLKDIEEFMP
jgi:hypothetical protein